MGDTPETATEDILLFVEVAKENGYQYLMWVEQGYKMSYKYDTESL